MKKISVFALSLFLVGASYADVCDVFDSPAAKFLVGPAGFIVNGKKCTEVKQVTEIVTKLGIDAALIPAWFAKETTLTTAEFFGKAIENSAKITVKQFKKFDLDELALLTGMPMLNVYRMLSGVSGITLSGIDYARVLKRHNEIMTRFLLPDPLGITAEITGLVGAGLGDLPFFNKYIISVNKLRLTPKARAEFEKMILEELGTVGLKMADLESRLAVVEEEIVQLKKNDERLKSLVMSVQTELAGFQQYTNMNIDALNERVLQAESDQAALEIMITEVANAGLSQQALNDVLTLITQAADELRVDISAKLEHLGLRVGQVEQDVVALHMKSEELLNDITKLESLNEQQKKQIAELRSQLKTKTTPEEVVKLIIENTTSLTEGQREEVGQLVIEFTKQLSQGQTAQVQSMIQDYVDPKFAEVDDSINMLSQQQQALDKITSATSILNSFASSAKVSVWKNKDGKFNTARLASDSIAGVALATAGGLLSNTLIKKNQVKKGMEGIRCTVAGQVVAEYGDEFMVGMQ